MAEAWKRVEYVALDDPEVTPAKRNPRRGDVALVVRLIRATGWHGSVTIRAQTNEIVVGNHRWLAAREVWQAIRDEDPDWVAWAEANPDDPVAHGHVAAERLDLTDAVAKQKLLGDNRASDVATYEAVMEAEILAELAEVPGGLEGAGYDERALDALIADVNRDADTTLGEPVRAARRLGQSIVLTYADAGDLRELTAILEQVGGDSYALAVLTLAREWATAKTPA